MGTHLTVQKRGKGSPAYKSPGHRFVDAAKYPAITGTTLQAQVIGFTDDAGKSTLLAELYYGDGRKDLVLAAEGLCVGESIGVGAGAPLRMGSVLPLSAIPDGTPIFNIELHPGDGGRLARSSGTGAYVSAHDEETGLVTLTLLSSKSKNVFTLNGRCRATIGVACGGGRLEKPFRKAGNKRKAMEARNKYYPIVRSTAMSAYDHPHGGKSFGKSSSVSRNAPPGQKVGHIASRRTGRKKGKERSTGEENA